MPYFQPAIPRGSHNRKPAVNEPAKRWEQYMRLQKGGSSTWTCKKGGAVHEPAKRWEQYMGLQNGGSSTWACKKVGAVHEPAKRRKQYMSL